MSNRYLEGPFAPVTEEVTALDLPVTGRLPADLDGRYLRMGPNPLGVEDPSAHFWAFGAGMVHGVRIRDGRAEWYRNRWVRSAEVADGLRRMERGQEPGFVVPSPNIHVIGHAGRTLALIEGGGLPHELGEDLDTIGPCTMGATPEGFSANAHSKVDPRTGDLHSLAYLMGQPFAQHIVTDPSGTVTRATNIPLQGVQTPFLHDFALSQNYVIVFDIPLVFTMEAMSFQWDPAYQARVGVLPRAGGEVRWLPVGPFYVSHVLNAHDDGSTITVDFIRSDGPVDIFDPGAIEPALDRWTIDPVAGTVDQRRLDDRAQDFPRVNDAFASLPHRFGYSAVTPVYGMPFTLDGPHPDEAFTNALVKHDLRHGTTEVHGFGRDAAVGEATFAANPSGGGDEDDGYLMAYVADPDRGASDLVILSAQDFTGPPVARVHLPVRVPLGFHGNWIPDA
ncbi:carotenoid oxygenase family protein [Nonomuraea sp. NPDC055795]